MKSPRLLIRLGTILLACSSMSVRAQTVDPVTAVSGEIDPGIARVLAETKAIDNHAHPVLSPPQDKSDRGFDALPVDNMVPETDPVAWRPDNPQLPLAWKALWGFTGAVPLDTAGLKQLEAARERVKQQKGPSFDAWVLDQAGIETMVANRVSMRDAAGARGLLPPRFAWVPYLDALLFPLDNTGLARANPDRQQFFPLEDRLRAHYLADLGMQHPPATLADYLSHVIDPTLTRQKANGAIAAKFEIAYLRSFAFGDPSQAEASRVYQKWIGKAQPDPAEYKILQDYLFRYIAAECGRLGMAVHLHTMAGGGAFYDVAGGNPLLLEPVFDDPQLRQTKFVMLHGGWPYVHEAGALLQKPNVYLDLSQETLMFSPRTLSGWLREWLEMYPEKVLFGTDGYPFSDAMGWEESAWLAARNGRAALGLALTRMFRDREITRQRAEAIAREVLAGNALSLYGPALTTKQPVP